MPARDAWGPHTIRRRVVLLVGFGVLAPLALLAWSGAAGFAAAGAWLQDERRGRAEMIASRVDAALAGSLAHLAGAASGPDLAGGGVEAARAALHRLRLQSRLLERTVLIGSGGEVVLAEPPAVQPLDPPADDLEAVRSTGRPRVLARASADGLTAWLLVPVRDWGGRIMGVVAGVGRPTQAPWMALLGSPGLGSGSVDLVDDAGSVVASTVPERLGRVSEAADWLARETARTSRAQAHASSDSGREVLAWAPLRSAPWGVLVRQPEDEAFGGLRRLESRALVVAPILVALALGLAWGAARSVTSPLAVLGREAERLAGGSLDEPIPDLGEDEVGRLGRALEAMRAVLAASLDAERRAKAELEQRVAERTAELSRLYAQLSERDRRRGQLLEKVIGAQEEERKRIARDLHDQTAQDLAALVMRLDAVPPEAGTADLRARLDEGRDLGRKSLESLHELMLALRPSVLDDLGLAAAVRWLAARVLEPQGVAARCEFEGFEPEARLPTELETAVFRAVQEALQNVARHARAEAVLIQVVREAGRLNVEIEDDGVGFDPSEVSRPGPSGRGLGLLGMRERMELFGGTVEIDSAPGDGTRVVLSVPVEREVGGG